MRRGVLCVGLTLGIVAAFILLALPLQLHWLLLAELAWLVLCTTELCLTLRCYRGILGYRLYADGEVSIEYVAAGAASAQMAAGSVVLRNHVWLRFCTPGGASWGELLARSGQNPEEWRRLQVICRHRPAC